MILIVKCAYLSPEFKSLATHQKEEKERREMEEILRETHGVNMYHWLQKEAD